MNKIKTQWGLSSWNLFVVLFVMVIMIGVFASCQAESEPSASNITQSTPLRILANDMVVEPTTLADCNPPNGGSPEWCHTSDFMLGNIAVSVILPNCSGSSVCSQGGWTANDIAHIKNETLTALEWWEDEALAAGVNPGLLDFQLIGDPMLVSIPYEPIDMPGGGDFYCGEEEIWIDSIMTTLGYDSYSGDNSYLMEVRDYNHDLIEIHDVDWAFTVFVADSSANADGMFAEVECGGGPLKIPAYAYLAGPFTVMNSKNNGFGEQFFDGVAAHEVGHIFGAPDEVASWSCQNVTPTCDTKFGYLGGENQNCDPCFGSQDPSCVNSCAVDIGLSMMRYPEDYGGGNIVNVTHSYMHEQLGWADSDNDGIPNVLDTTPSLSLISPSDPTSTISPEYTGSSQDIPFPTAIPGASPWWRPEYINMTINDIIAVEYRINGGFWMQASPSDGKFDSKAEDFTFRPLLCENGVYSVEVRSKNTMSNFSNTVTDTITVNAIEECSEVYLPVTLKAGTSFLSAPLQLFSDTSTPYPAPSELDAVPSNSIPNSLSSPVEMNPYP